MARVLIIRQYVADDVRVMREIRALTGAGHEVDLLCVRDEGEPWLEREGLLTIRRVPFSETRGGTLVYLARYLGFLLVAAVLAAGLHVRRRYDLVQVNTLPDTLVFAALVPKLLGAKVLLDLHETMPEFFATKFGVGLDDRKVRLVARAEQTSIRFADAAITCTDQMREAFVARGATRPIDVILNSSDEELFDPSGLPGPSGETFTLVIHGTIEERYGLDTLVRAVALLRDEMPDLRLRIFGDGGYRPQVIRLAEELGVDDIVDLSAGFAPYPELLAGLAAADAGVVAMKRDAFRDLTHCNKMFDFIAMRRPQLVSRTRSVEAYFDDDSFAWFTAGDPEDLARAIRELRARPDRGAGLAAHAAEVAEPYRWPHQRERYLAAVDRLLGSASRAVRSQDEAPRPTSTRA